MVFMRSNVGIWIVVSLVLGTAGCGVGTGSGPTAARGVPVVAAENFYGDIAAQLGGPRVVVTSILSDPNADPHLFEPGTAAAAAVSGARLVIENGLGYDAFVDRLLAAAPNVGRRVVNVAGSLGLHRANLNPHLWYDVPALPRIAQAISAGLSAVDPAGAASYRSRLQAFESSLQVLDNAVAEIRYAHRGAPVAYTEPVPAYLLQAAGLIVRTPPAFALAIEDGRDPTPQAVAAMEALLTQRGVRVLLYNRQATSPLTQRLQQLAADHGIPVVSVTETMPPGATFVAWQLAQIRALAAALGP